VFGGDLLGSVGVVLAVRVGVGALGEYVHHPHRGVVGVGDDRGVLDGAGRLLAPVNGHEHEVERVHGRNCVGGGKTVSVRGGET